MTNAKKTQKRPKKPRSLAHLEIDDHMDFDAGVTSRRTFNRWARRFLAAAEDDQFERFDDYLCWCDAARVHIEFAEFGEWSAEQYAVHHTIQLVAALLGYWEDAWKMQSYDPADSEAQYIILVDAGKYAGARLLIGDPFDVYFAWLFHVASDAQLELLIYRADGKRMDWRERRHIARGVIDGMDYDMPGEYECIFDGRSDHVHAFICWPGYPFEFRLRKDRINWTHHKHGNRRHSAQR